MVQHTDGGLRERKKRRTRASLIDAAAELCLRHGYDATTVEQIAAAADVSPRTFSRYFPTKESVVTAMTGDLDVYIAAALREQPTDITEYEALMRAHLEVFESDSDDPTPGFRRMAVLIQIVNKSESLGTSAFMHQRSIGEPLSFTVMGERMGVPTAHPALRMVADTWTILFANAFAGMGTPGHAPVEPGTLCDGIRVQFEQFRRSWSPWNADHTASGQPHVGAPDE
jgi:AcrR family transcriptional regulator